MVSSFQVFGIKTGLLKPGDNFAEILIDEAKQAGGLLDGDIIVIAESALATAEGAVVRLKDVIPSKEALEYSKKYGIEERLAEVVIQESDSIVGGIPGFLLSMKNGTLLPNAGIDGSNAPPGAVVTLPKDPDKSARKIHDEILLKTGINTGIIVADSRTHAMRLGCSGVAIGCYGMTAVTDERGKTDLFGRELEVTQLAIADSIASAAELTMGEANECTPAAIVRGLSRYLSDESGIEGIEPSKCLFMGVAMKADLSFMKNQL
ncbi:coenzyme F420-0:L-glutamate ligase [Methanoplanus sp. FWC-SCC4]|uniref:Coenzyme F420-0:L-glutamate ligase n=1 Tax=Methanochimaera problematica TaxID=2609417 RepID=A0AA97I437_9EURY|nr:coenzyme F420-0:L-glutamate ligase [Methanoplanus sp. FWC-SCC4]WOF16541.1 coenzyme F420-0:L-glutamate ligase [Methanoplanus sp. FWC-SCC4]